MKPGTKPKPTHLKLVTGNPGKRPLSKREPIPELSIPTVPPELCDDAKLEWGRVTQQLFKLKLLSELDRGVLAAYCQSYGRWIMAERAIAKMAETDKVFFGLMIKTKNGNAIQNPLVGTANKAHADMARYAAEFGMTPSARTRVHAETDEEENGKGAASYF